MFTNLFANPVIFFSFLTLFGLIVGSFLNVVVHRLPIMMERSWHKECADAMDCPEKLPDDYSEPFNLAVPRSRCPHCGHMITAIENIPILSYLVLRGKCTDCGNSISARYPLTEAACAILTIITAWILGPGWGLGFALLLTWALLTLSLIDYDHMLLPDNITLPLLWIGLLCNVFGLFTTLESAVFGAVIGYMSLWSVYWLFKLITGKDGMGYGDFKLFAALGAWLGWEQLPIILLLSSLVGALIGLSLVLFQGRDKSRPIPFGPYLAGAGWLALLWGNQLERMIF